MVSARSFEVRARRAKLTRQDGLDFLSQLPLMGIVRATTRNPLQQANEVLADLRAGRFEGAAVRVL
jgi:propanol-preferring alcohol dehydrogenase